MRIQRVGERVLYTNPAVRVVHPRGGAAVIPWYLSGGIAAANCIAAYRAKGAANYAASIVNLANPGTYDLVEHVGIWGGPVAWDAVNGWSHLNFNHIWFGHGAGLFPTDGWTIVLRVGSASSVTGFFFGTYSPGTNDGICVENNYAFHTIHNWGVNWIGGAIGNNRTMCIAGKKYYLDGGYVADISAGAGVCVLESFLGCCNANGTPAGGALTNTYYAYALYDTAITAAQVLAVSTAMAAL